MVVRRLVPKKIMSRELAWFIEETETLILYTVERLRGSCLGLSSMVIDT